jgi:hypothetical protein
MSADMKVHIMVQISSSEKIGGMLKLKRHELSNK